MINESSVIPSKSTAIKTYRDSYYSNSSDGTKNAQLKYILDHIQNNKDESLEVLKATVGYITGNQEVIDNSKLKLPIRLLRAIRFITSNSNNYWFSGSQQITRGTAQIIFATCYLVAKQSFEGYKDITGLNFQTRASKFRLIDIALTQLVHEKKLPISLQNDDGSIDGFDKSYLDCIGVGTTNENSDFITVYGGGYNYAYSQESSKHDSNEISEKNIGIQKDKEKNQDLKLFSDDNEIYLKSGKKENSISSSDNVIINDKVTSTAEMNKILDNDDLYKKPNSDKLLLYPYQFTSRGCFRETHTVLVVVHKRRVTVLDPDEKFSSEITTVPCRVHDLGWRRTFDMISTSSYVAHLTAKLKESFEKHLSENGNFDLVETINQISADLDRQAMLNSLYRNHQVINQNITVIDKTLESENNIKTDIEKFIDDDKNDKKNSSNKVVNLSLLDTEYTGEYDKHTDSNKDIVITEEKVTKDDFEQK